MKLETYEKILYGLGILTIILLIFLFFMGLYEQEKTCKEFGGHMSGDFTCIKENYHYDIVPTHLWSLTDYTVVIKPVEVQK